MERCGVEKEQKSISQQQQKHHRQRQQLQENHIQHQQSHLRNNNHVIYLFISVYSLLTVLLFYKIKASVHIELCPC